MKRVFRLAASMALPLSLWAAVATAQNLNNPNMAKPQGGAIPGPSLAPGNIGGTPGIQVLPRTPGTDLQKTMMDMQRESEKEARDTKKIKRANALRANRTKATKLKLENKKLNQQRQEADDKANNALCAGTGNC